ncbi:MAG: PDZ domain-containing protein [Flavobacteriales bacterium]|nr:PDZ domain-containing protein [Flavobacteriales bacterium]
MKLAIQFPALAFAISLLPLPGSAQTDSLKRTVRIEILRTENGQTQREVIELPEGDPGMVEDALRQAGVWEEMEPGSDENVMIDVRRLRSDGGVLKDLCLAFAMPEREPSKGMLGVYTETEKASRNTGGKAGARVTNVVGGSAAERAGFKEGDIIIQVGDQPVGDPFALMNAVRAHAPGDEVKITWYRGTRKMTTKVELDAAEPEWSFEMPEPPLAPMPPMPPGTRYFTIPFDTLSGAYLGVSGEDASPAGALVNEVTPGSAADSMGLREGDVIMVVDGVEISGFQVLAERIGAHKPGETVRITVQRDGGTREMSGILGHSRMRMNRSFNFNFDMPDAAVTPYTLGMTERERDELQREMDELRREMEQLRRDLRGDVMRRTVVLMTTQELSPSEQDMLKRNGASGLERQLDLPGLQCDPNPSQGNYQLRFDVPERGDLVVDVHNGKGERVYHETITGFKGRYERMLDLSDMANGAYYLVITQNGRSVARKLMKQ